jgi:hypothetical protein
MTITYYIPVSKQLEMAQSFVKDIADGLGVTLEDSTIASLANDVVEHVEMSFDTNNRFDYLDLRVFMMLSVFNRMTPLAEAQ